MPVQKTRSMERIMAGWRRRFLRMVVLVPVLALTVAGGAIGGESRVVAGERAPHFSATDLSGKPVSLEAILKSGKVVLLNFWGMRCANCIAEIGFLNPLAEKYEAAGAVFLGVNVDGVPPSMLNRVVPTMPHAPRYTVIPDPEMKIPDLYAVTGAPLSIVIGRDGKIAWRHDDFKEGDEKEIDRVLKETLSAGAR